MNLIKRYTSISLVLRIIVGLTIGVTLGLLFPSWKGVGIVGTVFVGALKAIAPVLVALLVCASVAKAGKGIGPRFRSVILLYLCSTLCSAFVAVFASFLFPLSITLKDAAVGNAPGGLAEVFSTLLANVVSNPVSAIANANYIGVLFWAVLLGFALKISSSKQAIAVVDEFANTVSMLVGWIIQFAPFGILGLVFSAVSENGLGIFTEYGRLILLLVGSMSFTALVVNPLVVFVHTKTNPYPLVFRALRESGISAFFTRSSAANIPVNMDLCKRLGLDEKFYSVSIPLGATINMNGAASTITILSLAVCHTVGVEVSFVSALLLCVLATLGACGASGVAGGSLLLVPMACSLFGISGDVAMQAVAVGFIIGVIQDSVETALNSSSDVVFTAAAEIRANNTIFGRK